MAVCGAGPPSLAEQAQQGIESRYQYTQVWTRVKFFLEDQMHRRAKKHVLLELTQNTRRSVPTSFIAGLQ
jgi:hypothetical protein